MLETKIIYLRMKKTKSMWKIVWKYLALDCTVSLIYLKIMGTQTFICAVVEVGVKKIKKKRK